MLDLDQYKLILDSSPNMVWRAGLDTKCDYFNKTWLSFTGKTIEQEMGDGWADGVHPDDLNRCVKTYLDSFAKQKSFEMNYRLKRFDGKYRIINDRGVPYYLDDGSFAGYVGSCIDVTEKVEGEMLRESAMKDGLTGIYNRQYFFKALEEEIANSSKDEISLTILMIDIDNFKKINDRFGHITGDHTIKAVADAISESIRENDYVGRFGGDEFIVLLPNTTAEDAKIIADRISSNVTRISINTREKIINVTISIGLACFSAGQSLSELIEKADKAMYLSKENGGNQVMLA